MAKEYLGVRKVFVLKSSFYTIRFENSLDFLVSLSVETLEFQKMHITQKMWYISVELLQFAFFFKVIWVIAFIFFCRQENSYLFQELQRSRQNPVETSLISNLKTPGTHHFGDWVHVERPLNKVCSMILKIYI